MWIPNLNVRQLYAGCKRFWAILAVVIAIIAYLEPYILERFYWASPEKVDEVKTSFNDSFNGILQALQKNDTVLEHIKLRNHYNEGICMNVKWKFKNLLKNTQFEQDPEMQEFLHQFECLQNETRYLGIKSAEDHKGQSHSLKELLAEAKPIEKSLSQYKFKQVIDKIDGFLPEISEQRKIAMALMLAWGMNEDLAKKLISKVAQQDRRLEDAAKNLSREISHIDKELESWYNRWGFMRDILWNGQVNKKLKEKESLLKTMKKYTTMREQYLKAGETLEEIMSLADSAIEFSGDIKEILHKVIEKFNELNVGTKRLSDEQLDYKQFVKDVIRNAQTACKIWKGFEKLFG